MPHPQTGFLGCAGLTALAPVRPWCSSGLRASQDIRRQGVTGARCWADPSRCGGRGAAWTCQPRDGLAHRRNQRAFQARRDWFVRVCSTPGCPTLVPNTAYKGRCSACSRIADRERGSRAERDYGADHRRERAQWQARMDAGETIACWRCGEPVDPRNWVLGHDDYDRTITRGPEHPHGNYRAAGRVSHGRDPGGCHQGG